MENKHSIFFTKWIWEDKKIVADIEMNGSNIF